MIKDILENQKIGDNVCINGRIFKIRKQATITFIELKDGSTIQPLQCIFDELIDPNMDIKELNRLDTVSIKGEIVKSPAAKVKKLKLRHQVLLFLVNVMQSFQYQKVV
jgi:aspartyl/asparaginyl-tRNA synthetase